MKCCARIPRGAGRLRHREQFSRAVLAATPKHRIAAIVDSDGPGDRELPPFGSGALLIRVAEGCGRLAPDDTASRHVGLQ
jgi:GST-like protein